MRLILAAFAVLLLGLIACQSDEGIISEPSADKMVQDPEIIPEPIYWGDPYIQHMDLTANGQIGVKFAGIWSPGTQVNQVYMVNGVVRSTIPFTFVNTVGNIAYYSYNYSVGMNLAQGSMLSSELRVNSVAIAQQVCIDVSYADEMYASACYSEGLTSYDHQLVSIDGYSNGTAKFSAPVFNPYTSNVNIKLWENGVLVKSENAQVLDSRTLKMAVLDFDPFLSTGRVDRTKKVYNGSHAVYEADGMREVVKMSEFIEAIE